MTKANLRKPLKKPRAGALRRAEFKPNMRSATAVVSAIAFLQKIGFESNVRNIKKCIAQRCRKPVDEIMGTVPGYLARGLELGILRKHGAAYKLGSFDLKRRKRKLPEKSCKKRQAADVVEEPAEADLEPDVADSSEPVCAY